MNRVMTLLTSPGGALLLFCAGLLLFTWPLLSIRGDRGGIGLFSYLFLAWTALVVLLLIQGLALRRAGDPERKG